MVVSSLPVDSHSVPFNDSNAHLTPELYDPKTSQFNEQQPNSIVRVYHSISLFLPDGRVFDGGSGLGVSAPTNHLDAQIYNPHYLFNQDGSLATRPTIDGVAKKNLRAGDKLSISASIDVKNASLTPLRYDRPYCQHRPAPQCLGFVDREWKFV
jgi:galactose oxidase